MGKEMDEKAIVIANHASGGKSSWMKQEAWDDIQEMSRRMKASQEKSGKKFTPPKKKRK